MVSQPPAWVACLSPTAPARIDSSSGTVRPNTRCLYKGPCRETRNGNHTRASPQSRKYLLLTQKAGMDIVKDVGTCAVCGARPHPQPLECPSLDIHLNLSTNTAHPYRDVIHFIACWLLCHLSETTPDPIDPVSHGHMYFVEAFQCNYALSFLVYPCTGWFCMSI